MPNRGYTASGSYRYGFNGKENDNDVKGNGNEQDYGKRIYDPRLGKFLSVDPLTKTYPQLTPYQFASNNPIQNVDIDGLEGGASNGAGTSTELPAPWRLDFLKQQKESYDGANWNGLPGTTRQSIFAKNSATSAYNQAISAVEEVPINLHIIKNVFSKEGRKQNTQIGFNMFINLIKWSCDEPYKKIDTYEDLVGSVILTKGIGMGIGNSKVNTPVPKINASTFLSAVEADGYAIVNDANGLEVGRASLNTNGDLSLVIRTRGSSLAGRGGDVFRTLHDFVSSNFGEVKSIKGVWQAGEMYGDNLKTFNELMKNGATAEEAARKTFTGKIAERLKFTKVKVEIQARDGNGNATSVNATFSK